MKIGIIGISSLTMELAVRSANEGYDVIIYNPKGNSLVRDIVEKMGPHIQLGSLQEAVTTEIIVLFIPKDDLEKLKENLPDMTGKLIVHTSGLIFDPQLLLSSITNAMTYKTTASLFPEAHVVKLFNPVNFKTNNTCVQQKDREEIFFIADHKDSRNSIREFLKKLKFSPVDLSNRVHLQNMEMNKNKEQFI
ncbi:putative dinucleotide-binding enzyme [Flavobacterium sp. 90]|uniref:NAD(P)-binding domain-containing protein n=1 Tax=unclassified Flavobacterium TaxID=196869 RepID=UPI000EB185D7|nr:MULTISPECIES: NAD(P)-binding domain-containing protein [unclassified Flavobacterium]RKR12018.1 putative dinucleotide-binding enzyme [Flavobacterium sp. 81]TCK55790.1 putative dinucleotide-binding enzyme [Flavobacterium sp. 90]